MSRSTGSRVTKILRLHLMKHCTLLLALGFTAALSSATATIASAAESDAWPLGLGPLAAVPGRYAPEDGSVGAARLKSLAAAVGIDFDVSRGNPPSPLTRATANWVEAQIVRDDDRLDPLPPAVAEFFRSNDRRIDEIRDLLVAAPIAWPLHVDRITQAPLPNLRAHLAVTRMLVTRALVRRSWDDLHAATALQNGMRNRPEVISQLAALTSMRVIAAAARKLPPPAPPWFDDVLRFDARRATIAAIQWEAWDIRQEVEREGDDEASVRDRLREIMMKPFDEIFAATFVSRMRDAATDLARSRQCAFDGLAFDRRLRSDLRWNLLEHSMGNIGLQWQRVARFTAEREATAIILALKEGRAPKLSSACSDGAWRLTQDASGAKHLRFSREIPARRYQIAIPLEYTIRPSK